MDHTGNFFVESANSGKVTRANASKLNNPFTVHFYEALKFLSEYAPFQSKMQSVFEIHGPFTVSSEMFPVLTHKGDEFGDIVFASTRYNKTALGNKGAFVCFDAESDGITPSDDILAKIENIKDPEWKVYNINKHGSLEREGLVFDVSGIQQLVNGPEKLKQAEALLRSRKDSPEKDALKKVIGNVKVQLQGVLNQYAEKINTFLSTDKNRKYPVEGVVLKINLPDEPIFIKGTSEIFHQIAEKTWGTRKAAGNTEKVFDGNFLTNVLGLTTAHAATLNKAVSAAKSSAGSVDNDVSANKVALLVYNQLKRAGVDVTSGEVKTRAKAILTTAYHELSDIKNKWDKLKKSVDPDTMDKTDSQLDFLQNRLNKVEEAVLSSKYTGIEYVVYLLRLFIDKRIKSSSETEV
jgi:hypothetical protein